MVPSAPSHGYAAAYFPRIRGDGPYSALTQPPSKIFSPYSRGWSRWGRVPYRRHRIFPVFAGMVPPQFRHPPNPLHFPRIRGDGPYPRDLLGTPATFSPYSRGWSPVPLKMQVWGHIFPVFAGMVQSRRRLGALHRYFPRIRGDGPRGRSRGRGTPSFSPYSRGWSLGKPVTHFTISIFPVFAGMVRRSSAIAASLVNFPRIRGDGPRQQPLWACLAAFSPYSRGWSQHAH